MILEMGKEGNRHQWSERYTECIGAGVQVVRNDLEVLDFC